METPVSPPLIAGPASPAAEAMATWGGLKKAGSGEDLGLRITAAWQDCTASPSLLSAVGSSSLSEPHPLHKPTANRV